MTTPQHIIRGLSFDPDSGGFVIEFITPTADVRTNGLILNHALLIPAEDPFIDLLEDLEASLQRALRAGLRQFHDAPPAEVAVEDEGPGPYDHPADGGAT